MNQFPTTKNRLRLSSVLAGLALTSIITFAVSCNKNKDAAQTVAATQRTTASTAAATVTSPDKSGTHQTLTSTVTIAMLRTSQDGKSLRAMFNENAHGY